MLSAGDVTLVTVFDFLDITSCDQTWFTLQTLYI